MKDIREIIIDEEKLIGRCEEIDVVKQGPLMREIIKALKDTMDANNLRSLSASQIGYDKRIFCIRFDVEIKTFINPVIVKASGLELAQETCTSFPGRTFLRPRNNDIKVMYQRPLGQVETRQLLGKAAVVFQHCLDHLDGINLPDISLEIDEDWDTLTDSEKEEIIGNYLDSIDLRNKDLTQQVEEDPDAKELKEGIEFLESVYKGETKLEPVKKTDKEENETTT